MRTYFATAIVLQIVLSSACWAQKLNVVATTKNWEVQKRKDKMTDKTSCTAFLKGRPNVQLGTESFYVSLRGRGGVSAYQLRFDDNPPQPMRLATQTEKTMSTIIVPEAEFARAGAKKRLRVSGLTILDTMIEEEFDLSDLEKTWATIKSPLCND